MDQQAFSGLIKFVGTLHSYEEKQREGRLIFAQITDQPADPSVSGITGERGNIEYHIYANGIDYVLPDRRAFNTAVENLRSASNINVSAFTQSGETLLSGGTLQETLEDLAIRIKTTHEVNSIRSANKGIEVTTGDTGTTVELKVTSTTIKDNAFAETEASYLAVDDNDGNKALRINEDKIQHSIVEDANSDKLVTEAAVWNTLAWAEVSSQTRHQS